MAGEEVLRAEPGSGVSASPYLRCDVQADADARMEAAWQGEAGGRATARLTVRG